MHVEVFYINRRTGWACVKYENGLQVGPAEFWFRKSHAIDFARSQYPDLDIHIYRRYGAAYNILSKKSQKPHK